MRCWECRKAMTEIIIATSALGLPAYAYVCRGPDCSRVGLLAVDVARLVFGDDKMAPNATHVKNYGK
jgi:hypothetical protein